MKKLVVVLTVGFLLTFSGKSEAWWHRGWHRCWAPRPVVVIDGPVIRPCYHPIWIGPHWGWRCGRRFWFRGCWR